MTVELTSPVFGKTVGDTYTGPEEDWLLAQGYAKRAGYTGPGVSNTGPTDVAPELDLNLASNREDHDDHDQATKGTDAYSKQPYDFDQGGVDTDPSEVFSVEPSQGAAAGGDEVTLSGDNFTNATGVTFGGVAAASFELVDDNTIVAVTPAHAAGAVDVVVVDADGNGTATGGFTYA